jgi:hypothetical protein
MMRISAIALTAALIAAQPCLASISPTPVQAAAPATDVEKDGAAQALAIFVSCVHYNGDVDLIRKWASESNMAEAPAEQAKSFLLGKPGKVYGGDTPVGQLILASEDNGVCSVFAGHADGRFLRESFELWLKQNGFTFAQAAPIHHEGKGGLTAVSRNYSIHGGQDAPWHAVITITTGGRAPFEAILTAYRPKH